MCRARVSFFGFFAAVLCAFRISSAFSEGSLVATDKLKYVAVWASECRAVVFFFFFFQGGER